MDNEDLLIFSQRVRQLRIELNLTQKEFSEKIGLTASALSAYENNTKNPSILVAKKIAENYQVSIDWLCGLVDEKTSTGILKYSDIYKRLVEISTKTHFDMYTDNQNKNAEWASLIFSDQNIIEFIGAWIKAKSLYDDEQIDANMYADLLKGLFNRYDEVLNTINIAQTQKSPLIG